VHLFIELLAAVPSVIYGLLAIFTLVPLMRDYVEPALKRALGFLPHLLRARFGVGYLTAGVVLAIMTVAVHHFHIPRGAAGSAREQREAALALGATRWESTWQAWCLTRGWAFSARFFWAWRALWAKPWRSPW
jgi:phosphate transport system permease protein